VIHGYPDSSLKRIYRIDDQIENNIRVIGVAYRDTRFSYILYNMSILIAFALIRKDFVPDLIHVHVYSAGIPAYLIKKVYKIPYIVTEHYGFTKEHLARLNPKEKPIVSKTRTFMAKLIFRNASFLAPVSNYLSDEISRLGICVDFRVIPNIVDTGVFYPPHVKHIENGCKNILFVGFPTKMKGFDVLIEAVTILKDKRSDFKLHIVGDSEEREKYQKMVIKNEIQKLFIFHGLKSKKEVSDIMRESTFFVLSSLFETQSCVTIEAMASGLPVIATDVGGVKEVLNDREKGMLIPPGDSNRLSAAIDYMLDNYSSFNAEVISRYAMEKYSDVRIGKVLHETYEHTKLGSKCKESNNYCRSHL